MKITTPGRICLFGEHQDYLGLPVIALAISLRSTIKAVRRNDRKIIINMPDVNQVEEFSLDNLKQIGFTVNLIQKLYNFK